MGGPGSGGARPHTKDQDRMRRALELRLAGATYAQIAQQLGYANKSAALDAVKGAMGSSPVDLERRRDERDTELARLDALLIALWPQARKGDVHAIDRVLKIGERRAMVLANEANVPADPAVTSDEGTVLSDFTERLRDRQANARTAGNP